MISFLEFVVLAKDCDMSEMMASRVLPSFLLSVRKNDIHEFSEDALKLWVVDLLFSEIKTATVKRYLGGLHTLYKEWAKDNDIADDDPFKELLKVLPELTAANRYVKQNLKNVQRIIGKQSGSSDFVTANIFLYLLYDDTASLTDVINLKFEDFNSGCSQLIEIVERMQKGRTAKYVFPLGHGDKRLSAITNEVNLDMQKMLAASGFRFDGVFSRDSITAIWTQAAWQCGVDALTIRSMLTTIPAEFSFLSILTPREILTKESNKIIDKVASSICDRTMRWFVMKLRVGRTPDDVKCSLNDSDPELVGKLMFYYPTRRVVKKLKNKNVNVDVPYLPDILFFRAYQDQVGAIMRGAGDSGWCFKVANTPDSPYATISLNEMIKFQRHVGSFTPDVEMELVNLKQEANIGDEVRIIGGDLFEGQEGEITRVKKNGNKLIYSIRLSNSLCINWSELDVPAVFIEPITQ